MPAVCAAVHGQGPCRNNRLQPSVFCSCPQPHGTFLIASYGKQAHDVTHNPSCWPLLAVQARSQPMHVCVRVNFGCGLKGPIHYSDADTPFNMERPWFRLMKLMSR